MFDMKEWERFMVKEKKKVITVDDRYKAKLSAVLICKGCNAKNTINVLRKEKKEEMRAGDYICYYYKPYGPAGDKKAYFETHVLAIKEQSGELHLVLENGHVLVEDTQVKRLKDRHQKPVSKSCYKSLSEYKLIESSIADEASRYGIYSKDELKNDLFDIMKSYNEKVKTIAGNSATFSSDLESSEDDAE